MKSIKESLQRWDCAVCGLVLIAWLGLAFLWVIPILGDYNEDGSTPMVKEVITPEWVADGAETAYVPLQWVVSPMSFNLEENAYGQEEPVWWSWLLMPITFIIGVGVACLLFLWMRLPWKVDNTWEIALKLVLDINLAIYLLTFMAWCH